VLGDVVNRLSSTGTALVVVLISMVAIYAAVVIATRVAGPRSLAQMSAFDFVATVALGSIIASVGVGSVPLADGVVAVVALLGLQYLVATLRRVQGVTRVVDSDALLLVTEGEVIEAHLAEARLTRDDLRSHLRRANVTDLADVRAVVLETTGDVNVLTGEGDVRPLLQGVRGADGAPGPRGQLSGG
jgi:uncharacterized membrane protein YcaP (DUF421 family)